MSLIKEAVGPGKPNNHSDVAAVQQRLNQHATALKLSHPLVVDGRFGPATEGSIKRFQASVMKSPKVDGCVFAYGATLAALRKPTQVGPHPQGVREFVEMALPAARRVSARWNVPVAVILAQSALESGWGKHVVSNAYFGIKGKSPAGASATFGTTEVINGKVIHIQDSFRGYTGYEDSADDYGRFLNGNARYRGAFAYQDDPVKFIEAVAKAGYATDPNYAKSLTQIIRTHKFAQYDTPIPTRMEPPSQGSPP